MKSRLPLYALALVPLWGAIALAYAAQVVLIMVAMLAIPFTVGLAILASHLWDIDLVIQRTLVYSALSTLLARSVTAVYRQHEVRKLIQDGNQPLQDVVTATRKIVKNGIIPDLQAESALVERYYDNFMLAPGNPAEPVAMALARESKAGELGRVRARIQTAQHYDVVLERIAAGHQYLYEHREMISNDKLGPQFKPYVEALRTAFKDLLDASR